MTKKKKAPVSAAAAAAIGERLQLGRLHRAVRRWAERRPAREKWSVAFSGGADSLALLLLLWAHWPKRRSYLEVLHFDHRLRGRESRADVDFCRRVCRTLKVKFVTRAWTGASADASEADARQARLAFFARHGRVIWLGHQQDDIAESMLMRLARGSGSGGLSAPRPVQKIGRGRIHLRPLLDLKKAEIEAALSDAGVSWRADSTNASDDFFRNRVRHRVLPTWCKSAQRDALAGAARSRELLEEDDAALETWLDTLDVFPDRRTMSLAPLARQPRALVRRALHRWLLRQPQAGDLSRAGFEVLLEAVEAGRPTRQSLGREGFAVIAQGCLRWETRGKTPRRFQRHPN